METSKLIDTTMSTSKIVPTMEAYRDVHDFLAKHVVPKGASGIEKTNTRIGDAKSNIYGGTYHIPDAEYPTFLKLYHRDIIATGKKEYLTEKQRDNDGPILVDLDLRHTFETDERQYTPEHVEDIVQESIEELGEIYQMDPKISFPIYVFEKPTVKRLTYKNLTKYGMHIIIELQAANIIKQNHL